MARRKGGALSSTTQRVLSRSQNGEGDTLRRDLQGSERGGRNKPYTWQPERLKFLFLNVAIVVSIETIIGPSNGIVAVISMPAFGHGLDADLRATHERYR